MLKGRRFYLHGYDECYYWRKWSVSPELKRKIELIKGVTDVPVVAGFGIRNQEHVKDIGRIADGVVIGSEIVKDSLRVILVRCFNF